MDPNVRTLVVDDNRQDRLLVVRELKRQFPDIRVTEIADGGQLAQALDGDDFGLVITDYQLRWSDGLAVLRGVKERYPECPVIMFTATGTEEVAVEAMKAGLDDYILKSPKHLVRLSASVRTALDRAEARQRVTELQTRLHSLLNRLNIGVFRSTDDGRLVESNPAFLRLLGVDTLEQAQALDLSAIYEGAAEQEGQVQPQPRELYLRRASGESVWVSVSVSRTMTQTGEAIVEGLVEDINRRKALEADLQRHAEQLAEAGRRKDEFLAVLAHELRNPLAPIRNALHILEQPAAPPDVAASARQMMGRQIRNLTRLIDDLLDVSRIARGKVELRKEPLDLAAVVSRTLEAARPRLEERRLEVDFALPPQPVSVEADPVRLEQVFANLLDNAAKFTEPGGRVGVRVEAPGGEALVRVTDTGAGIPPEMLQRIFEPFTHVDRSRSGASQWGLGIGLALVRSLTSLHGGAVEAHSGGPGQGSEFVVRLPLLRQETQASSPAGAAQESPAVGPLRVLVVDDSRDAADSLAMMLRLAGHDVRTAYGGPEALEVARQFRPRLALLDLGMPGMDGYEVARRLSRQSQAECPVLVALTGWGQEEDRRRSGEAGFQEHLVKPVEPDALARVMARIALAAGR